METGPNPFPPAPQLSADQAAPAAVAEGPQVREHHVGMKVRLAGVVVQVLEAAGDNAADMDLFTPPGSPRGVGFEGLQSIGDGLAVGDSQRCQRRVAIDRKQGHRLRRGNDKVPTVTAARSGAGCEGRATGLTTEQHVPEGGAAHRAGQAQLAGTAAQPGGVTGRALPVANAGGGGRIDDQHT